MVNIKAPLLPLCPTSLIELLYLSIKDIMPVLVLAALVVADPEGRSLEISVPTPPLLFEI